MNTHLRGIVYLICLPGALAACADSSQSTLAAIGAAVADSLDPLNGLPTVVVNAYWCYPRIEMCAPDHVQPPASPIDASAIASAFAAARALPLLPADSSLALECPWRQPVTRPGMYARFIRPPTMHGDSAVVELATGCADRGEEAFEQVHEFRLRRNGNRWIVERRLLSSIT